MSITNAIASLAVSDIKAAAAWYEKLFVRAPDSRPMPELAEWKLIGGGQVQIYQLPERAGSGSVTLVVEDIEAQAAHLQKLGIGDGKRADGATLKTIMITDPDGNHIAFAQPLAR